MRPQASSASSLEAPPLAPPAEDRPASLLLPPRPNLGPEPWRRSDLGECFLIGSTLLVVILGIACGALLVRWRRKRRGLPPASTSEAVSVGSESSLTIDDRRVDRAEALRNTLIASFGPSWGAKTTEEIADDPELLARIGPERTAQLLKLLAEADRAKFAGASAQAVQGEPVADRALADLIEALTASRSNTALKSR